MREEEPGERGRSHEGRSHEGGAMRGRSYEREEL